MTERKPPSHICSECGTKFIRSIVPHKKKSRNLAIINMALRGAKKSHIAKYFGISRQRVYQIIERG